MRSLNFVKGLKGIEETPNSTDLRLSNKKFKRMIRVEQDPCLKNEKQPRVVTETKKKKIKI